MWHIVSEHFYTPGGTEFFYSIRRKDGSLLFRAPQYEHCDGIIRRLEATHRGEKFRRVIELKRPENAGKKLVVYE